MYARSYEISEEDADATVRGLETTVRGTSPRRGLVAIYHTIAFHMMMTFYILLIVVAIVAGKEAIAGEGVKKPSLMSFILLWHLLAIPVWFVRRFTLRVCQAPLGMLVGFIVLVIALLALQSPLATALENLISWIQSAPGELLQYFGW